MRDISLHILDIMQNSIAANAGMVKVKAEIICETEELEIIIEDNGCGIEEELLSRITDPFSTTRKTRKVGLGIPLFKASAEQAEGSFEISSQRETGTIVKAKYKINHIDRPALGELAGVIADMAAANPTVEIVLILSNIDKQFIFNSHEVSKLLGEVPLMQLEVINWMRQYIEEGIYEIFGGVLSEINS